jgi:hypothetical protein
MVTTGDLDSRHVRYYLGSHTPAATAKIIVLCDTTIATGMAR